MAGEDRSSEMSHLEARDEIDKVKAKLAFIMHFKTGSFDNVLGEDAAMGEYLVLADCLSALSRLDLAEGKHD